MEVCIVVETIQDIAGGSAQIRVWKSADRRKQIFFSSNPHFQN